MNRETELYVEHVDAYIQATREAMEKARLNPDREVAYLFDARLALENAVTVLGRAIPAKQH